VAERGHAPAPGMSEQVVAIQVHHLVPGGHEVPHELFLAVVARVDFCQRSELRVCAEDEIGGGGGPLQLTRGAIAALVDLLGLTTPLSEPARRATLILP
jgi:hypothetical protein